MSTETTTVSWGERLGSSIKGVIIGIVLFLAGIAVLFWNEGNYVKTKKTLEEGEAACTSLPSIDSVDSAYEGKLVHAKGKAVTQDQLTDDLFNFSQPGIRLVRRTEIYQWVESSSTKTEKNLGGSETKTTTYTYNQKWCSSPVDSGSFHDPGHDNFNFYPEAKNHTVYAQNVQFGAFRLNEGQIKSIGGETPIKATEITIPADLKGRAVASGNYIYVGRPAGYMPQPGMPMAQPAGYVQQPGMVQPVMPVAQPTVMPAVPVVTDGGYITAPTIRNMRISVNNVDGVPFIIDSRGNAAPVTANGVMWNGPLHQITATEPGNNMVYNKNDQTNPQYANIANYGSLPMFKVEAKEFVKLPDGTLARLRAQSGAWQVMINGANYTATVTPAPAMAPPAVQPMVQPVVQPGMPMPGAAMPMQPGMASVNPGAPQIGDVRITWTIVKPEQTISLVAVQNGDTFSPYVSKETGKSFDLLEMGEKTSAEMFASAHSANSMMTWLIRLGGWLAMYIGVGMVLKPLSVLGDVVPFIGTIIEFGGKLISFVVASVVALVVIAIAWLFYRPLIAIPLLVGAVALIFWLKSRKKKEEPVAATAGDTPPVPAATEESDK